MNIRINTFLNWLPHFQAFLFKKYVYTLSGFTIYLSPSNTGNFNVMIQTYILNELYFLMITVFFHFVEKCLINIVVRDVLIFVKNLSPGDLPGPPISRLHLDLTYIDEHERFCITRNNQDLGWYIGTVCIIVGERNQIHSGPHIFFIRSVNLLKNNLRS